MAGERPEEYICQQVKWRLFYLLGEGLGGEHMAAR